MGPKVKHVHDLNYQLKQLGENNRDAGLGPRHYRAALALMTRAPSGLGW